MPLLTPTMYPPSQALNLDIEAISGILGSVSIACWIVVFSPQIIENFRRGSADGLSVVFLIIWLAGDVFNILGAVLQGVLPTMVILAIYYTLADVVLLGQVFFYKGFTIRDDVPKPSSDSLSSSLDDASLPQNRTHRASDRSLSTERTPLLSNGHHATGNNTSAILTPSHAHAAERRSSFGSFRDHLSAHAQHLSPATPLLADGDGYNNDQPSRPIVAPSLLKAALFNISAVLLVCAAGLGGWLLTSGRAPAHSKREYEPVTFNVLGQVFGYICAALYLGSRIPQLLLNYRRKSTEGISMLFFLFACVGNLTYVLSILAYEPVCRSGSRRKCGDGEKAALYGRYFLVNLSWLLGSFGTLLLDAGVFVQYFMYRSDEEAVVDG